MRFTTFAAAAIAAVVTATPLAAEITEQDDDGFVTRDVCACRCDAQASLAGFDHTVDMVEQGAHMVW